MIKIRSGIGYDIHRIQEGQGLFLGGILVSDSMQAVAHSDGDMLIHAIADSLLGALGEPDIGEMFPDTDPSLKGMNSGRFLEKTRQVLEDRNYEIINIDCVVVAETPRISPYKSAIRANLACLLKIPPTAINVKAKTKEKLDSVGRGEAIECFAVSMIRARK